MRVLAVGDCGIDRYVDARADRPGGISLNFAANARRLFAAADRVGVLTVLGDDREAEVVRAAIERLGLTASSSVARRPGATPVQVIDHDAAGERLFVRYEAGVLAAHRLDAAERGLMARADVMIATVFTQIVDFFETVVDAPAGALRALDYCNLGTADDPLGYARRYAGRFDVGFVGLSPGQHAPIDGLETIARAAGKLIVVTLGPAGSVALGGPRRLACPAVPVAKVVDTTGAGDTFAAGFLAVYARTRDVSSAMRAGAAAAAATLGHMGAFPAELVPWPAGAPAAGTRETR
ncbi:MAG: PfkB family carbohydrate kinase [Alphaproteobacteria bacterium]